MWPKYVFALLKLLAITYLTYIEISLGNLSPRPSDVCASHMGVLHKPKQRKRTTHMNTKNFAIFMDRTSFTYKKKHPSYARFHKDVFSFKFLEAATNATLLQWILTRSVSNFTLFYSFISFMQCDITKIFPTLSKIHTKSDVRSFSLFLLSSHVHIFYFRKPFCCTLWHTHKTHFCKTKPDFTIL